MERVILVSVCLKTESANEETLSELHRLAHTAGAEVVQTVRVRVNAFHPATLLGRGKAEEKIQYYPGVPAPECQNAGRKKSGKGKTF